MKLDLNSGKQRSLSKYAKPPILLGGNVTPSGLDIEYSTLYVLYSTRGILEGYVIPGSYFQLPIRWNCPQVAHGSWRGPRAAERTGVVRGFTTCIQYRAVYSAVDMPGLGFAIDHSTSSQASRRHISKAHNIEWSVCG